MIDLRAICQGKQMIFRRVMTSLVTTMAR